MKSYKVTLSKCYEITVNAGTEEEAQEKALETPLEAWNDPYECDIAIEEGE